MRTALPATTSSPGRFARRQAARRARRVDRRLRAVPLVRCRVRLRRDPPRHGREPVQRVLAGGARALPGDLRGRRGGAGRAVPAALRAQLPELLWLLQLGVTLFWVQDPSSGSVRTRRLVAG
ncbi:hypothetical protein NKG05_21855 [Oerskovia sp. M15]